MIDFFVPLLTFFLRLASFFDKSCFIHFCATEKDLGYLGLWDCSPSLHGIQLRISWTQCTLQHGPNIFSRKPNGSMIVHKAHLMLKQWRSKCYRNIQQGATLWLAYKCSHRTGKTYHTNDSTLSKGAARRANKKRDAPCSTRVFKSENGAGAKQKICHFFLRKLSGN